MSRMLRKILRERARARAVDSVGVLSAPAELCLDRFAELASTAFAAPGVGLDLVCVPRREGFCHYAVDCDDLLEVCDAWADPVFRLLPGVVGAPYIRYYPGAPLTLARKVDVGMLCVLDTVARLPASRDQRAYLEGLARQAAQAIERRADVKSRPSA